MEHETRIASEPFELRAHEDEPRRVVGHAAVFNQRATIGGHFDEQIAPGAFTRALSEGQDVRALIDHNSSLVLGRTTAGTLSLSEDERGLLVDLELPDTQIARDLAVSMARGDINQMSFAFSVIRESVDQSGERVLRTVEDADLFDVSIVTYPAYENAEAALRSMPSPITSIGSLGLLRAKMKMGLLSRV